MSIAAIETKYKGYHFRSRLEARWAVFFDTVNIKYRYEVEGFENTETGEKYLPDFYLPEFDLYAEVKGDEERYHEDLSKIVGIMSPAGSPVRRLIVLGNIPYSQRSNGVYWFPVMYRHPLTATIERVYRPIVYFDEDKDYSIPVNWSVLELSCIDWKATGNYLKEESITPEFKWMRERLDPVPSEQIITEPGCEDRYDSIEAFVAEFGGAALENAYKAALSARFEFGESGMGGISNDA